MVTLTVPATGVQTRTSTFNFPMGLSLPGVIMNLATSAKLSTLLHELVSSEANS